MPGLSRRANLIWAAAYVASMAGLVYWLAEARGWALAELGTPAAKTAWMEWKGDAAQHQVQGDSLVERKVPKSDEPPALVILRDSFPGVLVTCLALGSFMFCFLMVVIRGTFRSASQYYFGSSGAERRAATPEGRRNHSDSPEPVSAGTTTG